MMSKRNLILSAIIIGFVAVVSQYFLSQENNGSDTLIGRTIIDSGLVNEIDEIEIAESDASLRIKKVGSEWRISEKDNFPVNMEKVFQLIDQVTTSKIASLVTKDSSRFAYFKVKAEGDWQGRGTVLSFKKSGQVKFKLLIGKHRKKLTSKEGAGIPDGTYIRLNDQNSVYLVKENLSYKTDPDEWIRTRLYKVEKDDIKVVTLENPETISFSREDDKKDFQLVDENKTVIDNKKVLELLEELDEFSLVKVQKDSKDFSSNMTSESKVSLTLFDGSLLKFQLFLKREKDDEEYWVRFLEASGKRENQWNSLINLSKDWYFNIYSFQAEYFLKTKKDFIPVE